jgi:hypothetical protein
MADAARGGTTSAAIRTRGSSNEILSTPALVWRNPRTGQQSMLA